MKPVKPRKLYLDTSVIGGYFDEEFKEATQILWHKRDQGFYQFLTSPLVDREVTGAPEHVRQLLADTFTQDAFLRVTEEAKELAVVYMEHKIVPVRYAEDALHVAIATVHHIHIIVSWNFKHLVNIHRENAFNGVNMLQGYPATRIISPLELRYDNEDETA